MVQYVLTKTVNRAIDSPLPSESLTEEIFVNKL